MARKRIAGTGITLLAGALGAAVLATPARAALLGFEAESGALGADFDPAQNDANASGGQYITTETTGGGGHPGSSDRVVTYSVSFTEAGTYDLYARVYVGANGANDDSMFYGNGFGSKAFAGSDWIVVNGVFETFGKNAGKEQYTWINLSTETGDFGENGVAFSVGAPGTETFQIGAREDGFRIDAIAFGTSTDTFTEQQLDAAVPEPGSLALLGLGGLLIVRRRRQG